MEKYLVTIEFRYSDAPRRFDDYTCRSKKITVGIYDDFNDACTNGNDVLKYLENEFPLHTFPDGRKAENKRFSKNGGAFGSAKTLITNGAYLKTPFEFYAKISTLYHNSIEKSVSDVVNSVKRYKYYKDSKL